ncbi:protein phosphatase 1 regulatory subunit 3A-like [Solea solea]|uniref:protein phosphatase 1 regulatory subunit 3A-like n=1 Tax=Solea solea TaxID=90069 RepID=UPI00272C73D3|nr:protein phosphatase 1 regulatory subunit 3A-like [Solea solea]
MSFLTIPSQEGLLTTIKSGKSREEAQRRSCTGDEDDDNNDDEDDDDEEDDPESIRLIPRCSPVPRKRGSSIYDETAEYMRIHLALGAGKRVSFADTTGGDLVDVKEFVAFDSDEEEDSARWKEEEEKYRTREREPTYHVQPEFSAPAGTDLLQAVRTNKVEVEQMHPLENEPLAFSGLIRVQNVSFHKAVYIRSTMDSWATYFDHPAEYVPGSHDGDTDQFSFKLSFAPPHVTHGSHIEFVVRYETSEGDFWANNSSKNYVVTLLLSYEEDSPQTDVRMEHVRSILRPPKAFSINDDLDLDDELENQEEEAVTSRTQLLRPVPVCPAIIQPEIDIEIAVNPFDPSVPPNRELPSAEDTLLSTHAVSPAERSPYMSSETTHQADSSFVLCASESVEPNKAQPLPRVHCELGNQTQPMNISPSAPPPPSPQQEPRSDSSRLHGEEVPPSEASRLHLPTTETNVCPTGEDGSTESPASRPPLELAAPSVAQCVEGEVELGLNELVEGLSEASTHCAESAPAVLSPVADSQASLRAGGEAPSSPELAENASASAGASETSLNLALQSDSACRGREEEDVPKISPDTLLENPSNTPSEAPELQSEHGGDATLMPSIIFLSGVVSLSIVMQEPSALFFIGLLLVLHRL